MGDHRLPSTYIKLQNGNKESGTPTIPRLKESRFKEQITAYPLRESFQAVTESRCRLEWSKQEKKNGICKNNSLLLLMMMMLR